MREWWRTGLPSALTLRAFAMGGVFIIFLASILARASAESLATWLFFCASGYVITVVIGLIVECAVRDRTAMVRSVATGSVFILAGPVTLTGAVLVASAAGVERPEVTALLVGLSCAVLATWLVIGARVNYLLTTDARDRQRLLTELAREKALALESARLVESDRGRLLENVRRVVDRRLMEVPGLTGTPDSTADLLRQLVDESIRPLSYSLGQSQVLEDELVDRVTSTGVPSPRPLRQYAGEIRDVDSGERWLVAVSFIATVAAMVAAGWVGMSPAMMAVPVAYVMVLALILLLADARAITTERELSDALSAADRESSLVRQSAWVARRHLANTVHGDVQARILASALRVGVIPPDEVAEEVAALTEELQRILTVDATGDEWRIAWDRMITMWQMAIEVDIQWHGEATDKVGMDGVAGSAVVAVVGEAITNAVRHGRAGKVSIDVAVVGEVERGSSSLSVEVLDDGAAVSPGSPSMGTATLEAVCSTWSLETRAGGHRFHALIPLRASSEKSEQLDLRR